MDAIAKRTLAGAIRSLIAVLKAETKAAADDKPKPKPSPAPLRQLSDLEQVQRDFDFQRRHARVWMEGRIERMR